MDLLVLNHLDTTLHKLRNPISGNSISIFLNNGIFFWLIRSKDNSDIPSGRGITEKSMRLVVLQQKQTPLTLLFSLVFLMNSYTPMNLIIYLLPCSLYNHYQKATRIHSKFEFKTPGFSISSE